MTIPTTIDLASLLASTTHNIGAGEKDPATIGAITGISPIDGHPNHYCIRKGAGSRPWSTEVIYVGKDWNIYLLSETGYRTSDGTVLNLRTFWRDINTPGVLWQHGNVTAETFWSSGYAVFNNISQTAEGLPTHVQPTPYIQHSVVKAESTTTIEPIVFLPWVEYGFVRSDRMNENTEKYTFAVHQKGLLPYVRWENYVNGVLRNDDQLEAVHSLGAGCLGYAMFSDGTESTFGCGVPVNGPVVKHSVRPVPPKEKQSFRDKWGF